MFRLLDFVSIQLLVPDPFPDSIARCRLLVGDKDDERSCLKDSVGSVIHYMKTSKSK